MKKRSRIEEFRRTLVKAWNYKWIYIMLLPVMLYFIVFRYAPMYGITIAFKDYNIFKGVFGSPWVGLDVFKKIFSNKNFWSAIKNTFVLNLTALAVSFPLTIIVRNSRREIQEGDTIDSVSATLHFMGGGGGYCHKPFYNAGGKH